MSMIGHNHPPADPLPNPPNGFAMYSELVPVPEDPGKQTGLAYNLLSLHLEVLTNTAPTASRMGYHELRSVTPAIAVKVINISNRLKVAQNNRAKIYVIGGTLLALAAGCITPELGFGVAALAGTGDLTFGDWRAKRKRERAKASAIALVRNAPVPA